MEDEGKSTNARGLLIGAFSLSFVRALVYNRVPSSRAAARSVLLAATPWLVRINSCSVFASHPPAVGPAPSLSSRRGAIAPTIFQRVQRSQPSPSAPLRRPPYPKMRPIHLITALTLSLQCCSALATLAPLAPPSGSLRTLPAIVARQENKTEKNVVKFLIFLGLLALGVTVILVPFCCIFCRRGGDEEEVLDPEKGVKSFASSARSRSRERSRSRDSSEEGEIDCGDREFETAAAT